MAGELEATIWGPGSVPVPGPQGPPGADGQSPVFSIGTVAQGTTAQVTMTGTNLLPVLNFVLPQGNPGNPGTPGQPATIAIGTVTTLPAGDPATATMTGTYPSLFLNLGLPTGPAGPAGQPGTATTIWSGNGAPADSVGTNGDFYVDQQNKNWWGPKTTTWGATPAFSMVPPASLLKRSLLTRTSNQAVGAWPVMISFQQVQELNISGTWSSGNPTRIVVPPGVNYASLVVQTEVDGGSTAGTLATEVYKNGVQLTPRVFNNSGRNTTTGIGVNVLTDASYEIPVVAGDYFEIQANQQSLSANNIVATGLWCQIRFS